ncbi:hypothetical protein HETIRDRAFT_436831 [Heterobasidion irregulare TC 32-1]|uniref:SAM-dependent MTase RsmB/NOP-type domain-containing protein n=1 Tax=Heterobasidion irregulare (strain TC 32-1) TaxID=747525 RepID=W4JQS1_HETIT|nr:uncharacterized protein HETIRDRAFT_436831 [Heterobasidion irregulare TC 32-1]ETW75883.1 hypothetical protein HETIRDRAFT_436831 [Heterobasidion irregulare TC 32-1]
MPRPKKSRRGRGNRNSSSQVAIPAVNTDDGAGRTDLLERSDMQNAKFEEYYRRQAIISAGETQGEGQNEWSAFMETLREPLPTTFRIAGTRQTAQVLSDTITKTYVPQLAEVVFEDALVVPPVQLSWYPNGLAWQLNVPKKVLRKSPEFKRFHSFLVFETEVGNISRQEAVSMLPPLFLDVKPHHKVLDMCAAPGSKTAQLLEALHVTDDVPEGIVVANDSDYKRTHLLIHQSARLPSPCFLVTNVDASIFPALRLPDSDPDAMGGLDEKTNENTKRKKARQVSGGRQVRFDRILCDVPCSGDGTIRKNVGIWKYWNPMDGNGLHGLQVRILQRAMRMLHPDGRIVYSTCSLNPIENEAVVAEALRTIPGEDSTFSRMHVRALNPSIFLLVIRCGPVDFEIVDVSEMLPSLVRRPGLTKWIPSVDRDLKFCETYDECIRSLPANRRADTRLGRSHWPPSDVQGLNLERCMRIYPHLQDTGGFFVAVLQRKSSSTKSPREGKRVADEASDEPEIKRARLAGDEDLSTAEVVETEPAVEGGEPMDEEDDRTTEPSTPRLDAVPAPDAPPNTTNSNKTKTKTKGKQSGDGGFKENPYTFIAPNDPIVQGCIRQLSLTPAFPASNVLVRNPAGDPARSLYLTNDLVHAVLQCNDYKRMRLMTAGTKIFTKHEGGFGRGRAAPSESAPASMDVTPAPAPEAKDTPFRLLSEGLPAVLPYIREDAILEASVADLKVLVESYYPLVSAFEDPFAGIISATPTGSHVARFKEGSLEGASLTHDLVLPIWKSTASVSLMIDKKAKSALSLRVFGVDLTVAGLEAAQQSALKKPRQPEVESGAVTPSTALDAVQESEEGATASVIEAMEEIEASDQPPM